MDSSHKVKVVRLSILFSITVKVKHKVTNDISTCRNTHNKKKDENKGHI